jgi:aminopeptidase N
MGFCSANPYHFHRMDGKGYDFLANQVLAIDKLNPQLAARLLEPLTQWKKYDEDRQAKIKACLQRIVDEPQISRDVFEVASKSLV